MANSRASFTKVVLVVPARNEAAMLPQCIRAVLTASVCSSVPLLMVVVLDACNDESEELAGQFGSDVHFVRIDAANVGVARAVGFAYARSVCSDDLSRTWYATTDADSQVHPDWLLRQLASGADMVLGVVRVPVWRHFPKAVASRYLDNYYRPGPGHDHIHGANLGFRADAYWRVGGFAALAISEDVDLVRRFEAADAQIHRDSGLSVATSDRQVGRAPGGFAEHLREVSRSVFGPGAVAGT